jgi:type IV secretory pathway VirB10-like protein
VSPGNVFVCHNCGAQFALRGNTLKEIGSLADQDKPEIPKREPTKREPAKIESRRMSSNAIFLVIFLGLIVGGILLLLQPWNPDQEKIEALQQKVESKQEVNQKEEKKTNLVKAVTKETEEVKEEIQPIEPVKVSQFEDEPETYSVEVEPKSYKIFDDSGMKVRSSSPDRSDRSLRWNFKRKTVTIQRSKTQRVYIAGDPAGKARWAVDDEIIVNGERIKGFSEEMTQSGYIPESNCLPPCDITHLVSADRETVLDIRLVDYGVLWGNTSLYIVIM